MSNYENIEQYADLVHTAAQNGGVDSYLKQLTDASFDAGVAAEKSVEIKRSIVAIPLVLMVGFALHDLFKKACNHLENRKAADLQEAEEAKTAIRASVKGSEEEPAEAESDEKAAGE